MVVVGVVSGGYLGAKGTKVRSDIEKRCYLLSISDKPISIPSSNLHLRNVDHVLLSASDK